MEKEIKTKKLGKLRIYLRSGETVKSGKWLHKIFPNTVAGKILEQARDEGFLHAHIFQTHSAYRKGDKIHTHNIEDDNRGLTLCIELVDEREKLETFFRNHSELLIGKTVIFKEVEYWHF